MDKRMIPYLYDEACVPNIIKKYASELVVSNNHLEREKAKTLLKYRSTIVDNEFLGNVSDWIEGLYQQIEKKFPYLVFQIEGRIKGFFSAIAKIEHLEKQWKSENDKTTNPFSRIHDFLAFRIVIEDKYPEELISEVYEIMNFSIQYFLNLGLEATVKDQLVEIGNKNFDSDLVFVPEMSMLKEEFQDFVKDYVLEPKTDGYQSLHVVLKDPFTQKEFELQVRTKSMDIASNTIANHDEYKSKRYGKITEGIDLSRIHMRGFRYAEWTDKNGERQIYIDDSSAGLISPIPFRLSTRTNKNS